jgi:hypothetical protein
MKRKSMFKQMSSLYAQGRELFFSYKQLTPTKDGSDLETMKYAWKNKDHTYKAFGIIDTGHKDYGVQMSRSPRHALKLITHGKKFEQTRKKLEKRLKRRQRRSQD